MRFQDKRVIVTGAASGIGLETARAFAEEGARVIGVDLNEVGARSAQDALDDLAGTVDFEIADISSAQACHDVVEAAPVTITRLS